MSGKQSGLDVVIQEEFIRKVTLDYIPENIFRFLPPLDSTEAAETLEISPF